MAGAFVAFHGSWNRSPDPQGGYNVVFQPLKDGKASGPFVVFADGFAGAVKQPGQAAHRPSGLAMGPDGALYISDDWHGRIWRVTYHGDPNAQVAAAPSPKAPTGAAKPQFDWILNDGQVAAVLTYIRNAWGNVAPPVSAGEVSKTRSALIERSD